MSAVDWATVIVQVSYPEYVGEKRYSIKMMRFPPCALLFIQD
jgi:hypothetical protein